MNNQLFANHSCERYIAFDRDLLDELIRCVVKCQWSRGSKSFYKAA
jgi:hypothetical protein